MSEIEIKEMTKEDIDEMVRLHDFLGKWNGFENGDAMESFKVDASQGMMRFGGSFIRALGEALAHADSNNTAKIIRAFRAECEEHRALHLKWMEQRKG